MISQKEKLHVLHIPSWYIPEGGQFCRNQVQALNNEGVYAAILANVSIPISKYGWKALYYFSKRVKLSFEDNINVYRHFQVSFSFLKKWSGLLWSWKTERMFKKYSSKYGKPDVIHAHSVLWGGYAAKIIKERYHIPYVITEHRGIFGMSCEWAENQFLGWDAPFMKQAFSNADLIIPVSNKLIPKISSFLTQNVPIRVVSNMINTDYFYFNPEIKKNEKQDEIRAVMVNGFTYVKAYDILFSAADIALEQVKNLTINIVGEDFHGEDFEKLWENVKNKSRIILSGELNPEGVRDALWKADFFIISSRVESQSVSVLEALSTGLPVVCTEVVPDLVANESNAIRVSVENVEALTKGILEMAQRYNDFDRKKIAENVKKIADRKVVADNLIQLYQSVI